MNKTAIITDTDSSLPPELAAQYGIHQVPIGINFKDESYISGLTIDDRLLFDIVDRKNQLPTTSAPNPEAYIDIYRSAFTLGAQSIVCICVSGQVSSTYSSAVKACEAFPGREIHVVDSLQLSMAQGYMVLAAAEAASRSASVDEIIATVSDTGKKVHTFAILSTLKYLILGGRVGKLAGNLANAFEIKPTLTIRHGELVILEKNRTQNKAVKRLLGHLVKLSTEKCIERLSIIHVNELQGAAEMESLIRETLTCPQNIPIVELTPGLSVHTGSGLVGVVAQTRL